MFSSNQTLYNIFILGVALLFMVLAWGGGKIVESSNLIDLAQDPHLSAQRGISDANQAFIERQAYFKSIYYEGVSKYPGVLEYELNTDYPDSFNRVGAWCGTEFNLTSIALNLEEYEHNEYYVLAYNLELARLINGNKEI
jgi:hypothetical protein